MNLETHTHTAVNRKYWGSLSLFFIYYLLVLDLAVNHVFFSRMKSKPWVGLWTVVLGRPPVWSGASLVTPLTSLHVPVITRTYG